MGDDKDHPYWCVMFNHDGHLSLTPSDGKHTPFGTKVLAGPCGAWGPAARTASHEFPALHVTPFAH